jgi:DNA-binding XRE family transcriptional regulator
MTPEEFRQFRKSLGLTQVKLAEKLGLTGQAIRDTEAGRKPIVERDVLSLRALLCEKKRKKL